MDPKKGEQGNLGVKCFTAEVLNAKKYGLTVTSGLPIENMIMPRSEGQNDGCWLLCPLCNQHPVLFTFIGTGRG